jgi:hypothetical protein
LARDDVALLTATLGEAWWALTVQGNCGVKVGRQHVM